MKMTDLQCQGLAYEAAYFRYAALKGAPIQTFIFHAEGDRKRMEAIHRAYKLRRVNDFNTAVTEAMIEEYRKCSKS